MKRDIVTILKFHNNNISTGASTELKDDKITFFLLKLDLSKIWNKISLGFKYEYVRTEYMSGTIKKITKR